MSEFRIEDVAITDRPAVPVAIMTHHGPPEGAGETVRRFAAWRKARRLSPPGSETYTLFPVDIAAVAPEAFRMELAASVPAGTEHADPEAGVAMGEIPGGRCAMLRLTGAGAEAALHPAGLFLARDWAERAGEAPDPARPLHCRRVAFFPFVPEAETVIELYLPLA